MCTKLYGIMLKTDLCISIGVIIKTNTESKIHIIVVFVKFFLIIDLSSQIIIRINIVIYMLMLVIIDIGPLLPEEQSLKIITAKTSHII